jgi:hypothetical protein
MGVAEQPLDVHVPGECRPPHARIAAEVTAIAASPAAALVSSSTRSSLREFIAEAILGMPLF